MSEIEYSERGRILHKGEFADQTAPSTIFDPYSSYHQVKAAGEALGVEITSTEPWEALREFLGLAPLDSGVGIKGKLQQALADFKSEKEASRLTEALQKAIKIDQIICNSRYQKLRRSKENSISTTFMEIANNVFSEIDLCIQDFTELQAIERKMRGIVRELGDTIQPYDPFRGISLQNKISAREEVFRRLFDLETKLAAIPEEALDKIPKARY